MCKHICHSVYKLSHTVSAGSGSIAPDISYYVYQMHCHVCQPSMRHISALPPVSHSCALNAGFNLEAVHKAAGVKGCGKTSLLTFVLKQLQAKCPDVDQLPTQFCHVQAVGTQKVHC